MPSYEATPSELWFTYYGSIFCFISWFVLSAICGIICLIDKIRGKNDKNDTTNDT